MTLDPGPDIWNDIISQVLSCQNMTISKELPDGGMMPHPSESRLFRRSVGERKGQMADWRASISGSDRGVHVVEFKHFYSIHVDQYDPYKKPIEHLVHDSPKTGVAVAIAGLGVLLAAKHIAKRRKGR